MSSDKIISMTSAEGWAATFASLPDRSTTWSFPVIGWALIEITYDDGEVSTAVEPMIVVDGKHLMHISEYHADLATATPPERATLVGLAQQPSSPVQSSALAQKSPER
jgi:hypothetical protein